LAIRSFPVAAPTTVWNTLPVITFYCNLSPTAEVILVSTVISGHHHLTLLCNYVTIVGLVKHGYALRTVENDLKHRTWDCGRPGTELMTVISGVISWRDMLHDNDDVTVDFVMAIAILAT